MADRESGAEVVLVAEPGGLVVSGRQEDVERLVGELARLGGHGVTTSGLAVVADVGAAVASAGAVAATSCEYVRHTARSVALLRENGLIPGSEAGTFRSFVKADGLFAGNLDWSPVALGPERALSLQTAAVGLALRTAIKQVEVAIERVEKKVDRIAKLVRAERLGTAIGNHRTLTALSERVRTDATISSTDWSSVAALGPAIVEDVEALRAYIRSELADAKGGWRTRGRADDALELLDRDLVVESVGLLVVAEHNLGLWQELRIANVREREPQHLDSVVADSWATLRSHQAEDQAVLDDLRAVVGALTAPAAYDGLAPLQSQRLSRAATRLDELANSFAEQRTLDLEIAERAARPGVRDSLGHIGDQLGSAASLIRSKVRRKESDDAPPELPPAPPF